MTFDAFDVVIVPFPLTDRATAKRRPAVVLSHADFNAATGHIIAAMITSARQSTWASDMPLTDIAAAGLPTACVVRMKLFTLDTALVIRKAGQLGNADATAVKSVLGGVIPSL